METEDKDKIEWYEVLKNWLKSNLYLVFLSYSSVFIIFYHCCPIKKEAKLMASKIIVI